MSADDQAEPTAAERLPAYFAASRTLNDWIVGAHRPSPPYPIIWCHQGQPGSCPQAIEMTGTPDSHGARVRCSPRWLTTGLGAQHGPLIPTTDRDHFVVRPSLVRSCCRAAAG